MQFIIKNIGAVKSAEISLDGITVISGENNTGKSTVGKSLFSYFMALSDIQNKIREYKKTEINTYLRNRLSKSVPYSSSSIISNFVDSCDPTCSKTQVDNLYETLWKKYPILKKEEVAERLHMILEFPEEDLMNEYVLRTFSQIFYNQVQNPHAENSSVTVQYSSGGNSIYFKSEKCWAKQQNPVKNNAYYIQNPFVMNRLSSVDALHNPQGDMESHILKCIHPETTIPMTENWDKIDAMIKSVLPGEIVCKQGMYLYQENEKTIDFRNLSASKKAFALIRMILVSGNLKPDDVIILDDPENYLHPDIQLLYTELLVLIQKTFQLKLLIVTHNFHFIESLDFFSMKYEIHDKLHYYFPEYKDYGYCFSDSEDNYQKILESLSHSTFQLSEMQYEYESSHEYDDDDCDDE